MDEDSNIISTPLHGDNDPLLDTKGPYYVPWKKSSMEYYNKINSTKINSGYLDGSTLGNVGINNKKVDKKK